MASKIIRLVVAILICQIVGNLGTFFTIASIPTWYAALHKPGFSPPNWAFAPIWLTLYTLMGISLYLVWESCKGRERKRARTAIGVFAVQLALNFLWTALFFGLRSPLYGLVGIIILWVAILATILKFWPISRKAAILLIPYIAWVSIALALNLSIFLLNG